MQPHFRHSIAPFQTLKFWDGSTGRGTITASELYLSRSPTYSQLVRDRPLIHEQRSVLQVRNLSRSQSDGVGTTNPNRKYAVPIEQAMFKFER